ILIECTGLGAVDRPAPAGTAAPETPAAQTVNEVTVTIGGVAARVTFAGLAPGSTGRYQIRAIAPPGVSLGDAVSVQVTVAGQSSVPFTMSICSELDGGPAGSPVAHVVAHGAAPLPHPRSPARPASHLRHT